jgi:hypothetical protein
MTAKSILPPVTRFIFTILSLSVLLASTAAQDDQMQLRSYADYIYGQSMRFNLDGANVGEIDSVTVFFRLGTSSESYFAEVPVKAEETFNASYTLDLTQVRLPPFGSVTYWWEINRAIGEPVRVPEQVVSYVDDQFTWRRLSAIDEEGGGSIRIHWTGDSETLGAQAQGIIFEMLPQIGRLIPLEQILPFDVYIYPSSADLGAALRLAGREYQPGQTFPDLGVLFAVVVNQETAESELRWELSRGLVDLTLFQALGQFVYNLPPWLARGLAGTVRDMRDVVLEDTLRSAIDSNTLIPVADLCNGMPVEDDLAIAQSEALFAFIVATYGDMAVRDLILAYAAGDDCTAAMRKAIHLTPQQLETGWLRATSSDQTDRLFAEIGVWLLLVLAGFGLAFLLLWLPRRGRGNRS